MTAAAVKKPPQDDPPPQPIATYVHRKFNLPDLTDKGDWLTGRLVEHFQGRQPRELISWLRSVIDSNEYHFVRTDHAYALAQFYWEPLAARPVVREVFVLCDSDEFEDEAAYLYTVIYEWARSLGAHRFDVESMTDVNLDMIKARIGKLFQVNLIYAKLDAVLG